MTNSATGQLRSGPGETETMNTALFRLTRDTSAPGDGLRGSLLAVSPRSGVAVARRAAVPVETQRRGVVA
jgi:hypothetical protein